MSDQFEQIRRARVAEINTEPKARDTLEAVNGQVWNSQELSRDFEVVGYLAPYVVVRRRADGTVGSLEFQHSPRFYFGFQADQPQTSSSCSWCHAMNPATESLCRRCGHQAHVARKLCRCERCSGGGKPERLTTEDVEAALDWLRRRGDAE